MVLMVLILACFFGAVTALSGNRTIVHSNLSTNITIRKIYQPVLLAKEQGNNTVERLVLREKRLGFPVPPAPAPQAPAYVPVAYSYPAPPTCSSCQNSQQGQPQQGCQPQFPLPQCYTGSSGYMCCNHELEDLMLRSFGELKASRPDWSSANIDQISTQVQRNAEHQFGMQFEVVSGVGDYASKSNFFGDKICKIYWECRYILAYATPMSGVPFSGSQSSVGSSSDGCGSQTAPVSSYPQPPSYPQTPPILPVQQILPGPQASSYGTAPTYDEPRFNRFKPSVRIDTTSYDPQPTLNEHDKLTGDFNSESTHNNIQVPLATGPQELQTSSTQQDATSYDPKTIQRDDKESHVEPELETSQNETIESTTSSYGTQSISPPQEDDESVPRRAEGVSLYGPVAPVRKNLNYSWRL